MEARERRQASLAARSIPVEVRRGPGRPPSKKDSNPGATKTVQRPGEKE